MEPVASLERFQENMMNVETPTKVAMNEAHWRDFAGCRDDTEGLFFPDETDLGSINAAKAVCSSCPVQDDCLAYAIESNQTEGIWAGTTGKERRRIRREWIEETRRAS